MNAIVFMPCLEVLSISGTVLKSAKTYKLDILMPLLMPQNDEYLPFQNTLRVLELTPDIPGYQRA